ncbi:MAG TPA: glutamine-hydrolyzing GMP synthase [Soehngenia sp.]|jgi:GMP synthase (glutamine-hydrolysing)|nr:glutamine-hydrolyzing GMP synthase [Soehngenia sp.]
MEKELVLIIDFGGQYNQLIARRVRDLKVYCEIVPHTISIERIKELNPKAIIFTGGPNSVYEEKSPKISQEIFNLDIPILGICYGAQLIAYSLGGEVKKALAREYGKVELEIIAESKLYENVKKKSVCWMSHTDYVESLPEGFVVTAKTDSCKTASFENAEKKIYAVQYHPEVLHTEEGEKIISNFLYNVAKVNGTWEMSAFTESKIKELREKIGNKKVLCALSGGVDSSVASVLVSKAVGNQLTCIFVDHGLLRKDEAKEVEEAIAKNYELNFIKVDAKDRFLQKLKGITDPETKRKIIGEEFIRVFEEEAKKIGEVDFLVQGTIYPDVIESGVGDSAVIKSHHNVGGLPENVDFKEIIEPLRDLFKDEVRKVGLELGLPHHLVFRQPFPGPGLAIRVIGEVTEEKLEILREADAIFRDEIVKSGIESNINQYFAVLTNIKSVGVMGDGRTYDYTIALRAVQTIDFMTAEFAQIPWELLGHISSRIVNEVDHVNRIVYDITNKPPATIEWE